jgi:glutathione peroxidase
MMRAAALLLLTLFTILSVKPVASAEDKMPSSVLDFTLDSIDGKPYALSQHKGEVILLVNVASHCGFTPQYTGLQQLYTTYHDKGLTVIGVPANEFAAQEPGTNADIKEFCSAKFHVTFPMLGKVVVKGPGICPLYKYLTEQSPKKGEITWNFNKFLIGRDGQVIDRYDSKVKPEDADLKTAIEAALAAKK